MIKELEEAKQNLIQQLEDIKIANECGLATKGEFNKDIQALETILNYIDNSIPKEVVENKLQDLEKQYKIALEENSTKAFILKCQIEIMQEIVNLQSNKQHSKINDFADIGKVLGN